MFDLEQSIADWRREMAAGGVKSPALLNELESHLRDDFKRQVEAGVDAPSAFETASGAIGRPDALKCEFDKVGGTVPRQMKDALLTLAGIPNHYADNSMNATYSNLEPRWATYLKAAAFLLPAVCLWTFSVVFLLPKLRQISANAGYALPAPMHLMIFLTEHAVVIFGALLALLILLEWRSVKWPRYRRASIGLGVFLMNTAVMVAITVMVVLALISAATMLQHPQ